jgi:hypothetical protein
MFGVLPSTRRLLTRIVRSGYPAFARFRPGKGAPGTMIGGIGRSLFGHTGTRRPVSRQHFGVTRRWSGSSLVGGPQGVLAYRSIAWPRPQSWTILPKVW